jgi:hypothetical protein
MVTHGIDDRLFAPFQGVAAERVAEAQTYMLDVGAAGTPRGAHTRGITPGALSSLLLKV